MIWFNYNITWDLNGFCFQKFYWDLFAQQLSTHSIAHSPFGFGPVLSQSLTD